MKITVNLSPANIRKNGTAFDFPIAVAFLGCLNLIDASKLDDICIMGELGLNGKIRGVGNCLPIVLEARKQGIHKFFAASEDENTLRGIEDIEVVFMDSLQDVLDYFHGTYHQKSCRSATTYQKEESEEVFCDIIEEAGYIPMTYGSPSKIYAGGLDLAQLQDWPFWLAHYTTGWVPTSFRYHYHMWQYSSSGTVPGIPVKVDLNLCLTDWSDWGKN